MRTPIEKHAHRNARAAVAGAMLIVAGGCARPDMTCPVQAEPGYIAMLPGVGGFAWEFAETVKGLREAGVTRKIEVVDWHDGPLFTFQNLTDIETNRRRARTIADRISTYHRKHPDDPITLVGYSGGGGLAALVAASLEEDVTIDQIILIAAALSPDYDLNPAKTRCRRGIVNYFSAGDWFILGCGTTLFGTIDRVNTHSAGHIGFRNGRGEVGDGDKLLQIAWVPTWSGLGHDGGHVGWLAKDWARDVLAPQIAPTGARIASAAP